MDIATVDDLLTTTRSVRKRLDVRRPVEPEVLERCIEIAFQAPTGSNAQGWHFVLVTDAEKRARLAELRAQRDNRQALELMERLESSARGSENLMPLFIECAESGVTLGEICKVLRGVWGEYQPPAFL